MCFCNFQSQATLYNMGVGATFGESVLHDLPRDSTVVTKTTCELLRVEQQDFRLIWEVTSRNETMNPYCRKLLTIFSHSAMIF